MDGNNASEVNVLKELSRELVNRKTEDPRLDRKNNGSPF
jgi:hypothetical protein